MTSPTRVTPFTMIVTAPGIGVVATVIQTTPNVIHTTQKTSASIRPDRW
jgi:hypothetical protein